MKKHITLLALLVLSACGGGAQQNEQDKQIQDNQKKIELLKQEAEIQRLQNELQTASASAASAAGQVYQLAASEVANTLPKDAQEKGKAGEVVQGTDGQQYMFDPDTGNWLLYGAMGAAAGYLLANAMNKNKYQPAPKPTAAVERVYKDYQVKHPSQIQPPKPAAAPQNKPFVPANAPAQQQSPDQRAKQPVQQQQYRQANQGYSNHQKPAGSNRLGGGRRKR